MAELKQYTLEEVKRANERFNTMIVIFDKVYNVSKFLNEHPGGEEILIDHGGKDATEDFIDVNHSSDAYELMDKYLVGELVPGERRNRPQVKGWQAGYSNPNPEQEKYVKGPGVPFLLFSISVVLAVTAVLYLYL